MTTSYDDIPALNWSTLRNVATSARLLQWRVEHPRPDTAALRLGRAIHCALLEPERWRVAYAAAPDFGDLRTNTAKAKRAEWLASMATARGQSVAAKPYFDMRTKVGKLALEDWRERVGTATVVAGDEDAAALISGVDFLDGDSHALAERCAAAVRVHSAAAEALRGGRTEEAVTWIDPRTGLRCKGRIDLIRPDGIVDLKSTRRETLRDIAADCARYLYHGQLAWYHDGAIEARVIPADAQPPVVVIVQTVEPYDVVAARLTPHDLEKGRWLWRSLLQTYVDCGAASWFPGLAPGLIDLPLPEWAPSGAGNVGEENW